MEKLQSNAILKTHQYSSADSIRLKVSLSLNILCIIACMLFLASYLATDKLYLVPYVLFPFLLPAVGFYFLLKKTGSYKVIVALVLYLFSAAGLMHLYSAPDYLVDIFLLPVYIGAAYLTLKYRHAMWMSCYMVALYAVTSGIVYQYHPFALLYTNDNYSSVVVGFFLSITVASVIFHYFARNYQTSSDLLNDTVLTLSKVNDDNKLLISVVSHDFRNYLARVLLQVENSRRLCRESAQLTSLENIETSIHQLSELLNEVQQVRSMFLEEGDNTLVELSFADIMKKLDMVFRLQMYQKGQVFRLEGDTALKLKVEPDVFIHIILSNLIGNAVKFAPQNSEIVLSIEEHQNRKRLTVANMAASLQMANLENIQKGRDSLVSNPGTRQEQGQGLGISIVRRFCRVYNIDFALSVKPTEDQSLLHVLTSLEFN